MHSGARRGLTSRISLIADGGRRNRGIACGDLGDRRRSAELGGNCRAQLAGIGDGPVGRIDERLHEDVSEMLVALSNLDAEHMTAMILRVGKTPADLDRSALSLDVADFLSYYASQSLDRFDLSGALKEMMEQIRRYRIMLPAGLSCC